MTGRVGRRGLLLLLAGAGLAGGGPAAAEPGTFRAVLQENGAEVALGLVQVDPLGRLAVSRAGERAAWWRALVARMNAKDRLAVDAVGAQAGPGRTLGSRMVSRGQAGFDDALRDELQRYYGVSLR